MKNEKPRSAYAFLTFVKGVAFSATKSEVQSYLFFNRHLRAFSENEA